VTRKRILTALAFLLLTFAAVQGARGGWIHAKAGVAQLLMRLSWEEARTTGGERKPWPWADTWPVARLSLPSGRNHIVLAGASGRNLAFGPGYLDGSEKPGGSGTCVIAGHRDTQFAHLDRLEKGHTVVLEDRLGKTYSYRVAATAVVDENDTWVMTDNDVPTLVLITCWPLDGLSADGTQRYVVWAEADISVSEGLGPGA
jgi:sortase A